MFCRIRPVRSTPDDRAIVFSRVASSQAKTGMAAGMK